MRVFLDTNVLASAFGTRGLCADVLRAVLTEHDLITSEFVLVELERVLSEKFRVPQKTIHAILTFLRRFHVEPISEDFPDILVSDPDDLKSLASAISSKSDVLVSGDRDLLAIKDTSTIEITDPRGLWRMLKKQSRK